MGNILSSCYARETVKTIKHKTASYSKNVNNNNNIYTQFDDEPIDFVDPDKEYYINKDSKDSGLTILMKWSLLFYKDASMVNTIAEYIKQYPEKLNVRSNHGRSALYMAVMNIHTVSSNAIVTLLVKEGANVNLADNDGITALMICVNDTDCETSKLLLDAGADPNLQATDGWFALMFAARNYNHNTEHVVKLLLDGGANPNLQNNIGWTALMELARYGSDNIINTTKLLLQAGADVNLQAKNGYTALMLLLKYNFNRTNINVAKQLIAVSSLYIRDNTGTNAASIIAQLDDAIIFILLQNQFCTTFIGEQNCGICFENDNLIQLNCHHPFHIKCISQWLENKNSCPLCRRPVV